MSSVDTKSHFSVIFINPWYVLPKLLWVFWGKCHKVSNNIFPLKVITMYQYLK